MTRFPPLHEGHAPIFLHQAFQDALDAYEAWDLDKKEPEVEVEGRPVPISAVFGRMRTCTDLLPLRMLETVKVVVGSDADAFDGGRTTFADAALVLRAACVERLTAR